MYSQARGRRFKIESAKSWERIAITYARKAAQDAFQITNLSFLKGWPLKLEIEVCRPSWTGKTRAALGKWIRPDVSNFVKAIEDAMMKAYSLDDAAVVELHVRKRVMPTCERVHVRLEFLKEYTGSL